MDKLNIGVVNCTCPHPCVAEGDGSLLICFNMFMLLSFSSFFHLSLPRECKTAELGAIWDAATVFAAYQVVNG